MQRRRVHAVELGALVLNGVFTIEAVIDESNGVNFHGLRCSVSVLNTGSEPSASHGTWVVFCLPDETSDIPNVDTSGLEAEGSNAFIWGVGTWGCSVGTPCQIEFNPATSRNCQNGARVVFRMRNNVTTGTNPSVQGTMTYFTKSL